MSSKKNRFAKGLGASALAIATLASGLSFGTTSATAAEEEQTYADVTRTYEKFFAKMQSVGVNNEDNGAVQWFYALPSRIVQTPFNYIQYMGAASSESAAKAAAAAMSALSTNEWRLWQNFESKQCMYAGRAYGSGPYLDASIEWRNCNGTDQSQWFKLDSKGNVVAKNLPADMRLDAVHKYSSFISGSFYTRSWMMMTNRNWSDPTYGDGWKPGVEAKLNGVVEFSAANDSRAVVKGSTEANGAVEVRRGSTVVGSATANVNGDYSIAVAAPNKGGDDELTVALVENGADKKTIKVVAAYGAAVAITAPSNGDAVSGQYTITGKAQAESSVSVRINDGAERPVTVSGNGQWSLDATLPMGERTITATQKSKGANTTTASVTVNPGESSTAPLAITTPKDGSTVSTPSKRIEFSGTGEKGARVQVRTSTDRPIIDTFVGENGQWKQTAIGDLAFNVNYVLLTEYTVGGETTKGEHRVRLEDSNPGVIQDPQIQTPAAESTVIAPNNKVVFTGVGATGTEVIIHPSRTNNRTVATATVGQDGTWKTGTGPNQGDLNADNGQYNVYVKYKLPNGTIVEQDRHFFIKREAPVVQDPRVLTPAAESTVIAPNNKVEFTGVGTTGTKVIIHPSRTNDRTVATATVGQDGTWKTGTGPNEGDLNADNGQYNVYVKYTLPNGTIVEQDHHFFIKREASTAKPFTTGTPGEGSTVTLSNFKPEARDGEVEISGTGKPGGTVKVWNWHTKDRIVTKGGPVTVDENGEWTGVGGLKDQAYALHIEYFAPGADLDGAPTEVLTRNFTAAPPAGE